MIAQVCSTWFLVNDRLKLIAYRIFDPEQHDLVGRHDGRPRPPPKARSDKR